ncbi:MAG: hypothetical protein K6G62_06860, partial [Eubacterium sp.]|nr:hypothetical protein [Eubacterium sp.]
MSENRERSKSLKNAWRIYAGASIFCLVFFLIYNYFAHDEYSPYMTFLFAWPLVLGFLPSLILWLRGCPAPNRLSINIYNAGVATLTMGSAAKGALEIAGAASPY